MPKKKTAPKPKRRPMPKTSTPSPSSRNRRKEPVTRVSAAVSIDEPLYQGALKRAAVVADNNFSRYVRDLVKRDLNSPLARV